jgi:hypothetical protein
MTLTMMGSPKEIWGKEHGPTRLCLMTVVEMLWLFHGM